MGLFGKGKKKSGEASGGHEVTLQNGQSYTVANVVDCMGDSCPRPQLMTKKAISGSSSSDVIEVLIDNPTSMEALPPMCTGLDATHLETVSADKGCMFTFRRTNMVFSNNKLASAYVTLVALVSLAGLVYVYAVPPESMQTDRDGIPHFTPQVLNPDTGEPINMGDLIKHYRGD